MTRLTDEQARGIRAVLADALLRIAAEKRNENDGPPKGPAVEMMSPGPTTRSHRD